MTDRSAPAPGAAPALAAYATALGDDALVLGHRLSEWVTRAPQIEEDIALGNIALDLLGQARTLLTLAGEAEGAGRDEDELAYWRDDRDFRNAQLVEVPNGDFAVTMARQLLWSTWQLELWTALLGSRDETLSGLAGKAVKEVAYHRDHATGWVVRLGDGTEESHRRMQAGLAEVWPYVEELFDPLGEALGDAVGPDPLGEGGALAGVAVDPAALRPAWEAHVRSVLVEATLERPTATWRSRGGRRGLHTEHLGRMLAEMQHLHRSHPGASW